MVAEVNGPDPVDVHVGSRLRLRRLQVGVSQEALAGAIGVTFQQVQKYERGSNRLSASRLHKAARALQVSPAFFFEGLPEDNPGTTRLSGGEEPKLPVMTAQGLEVMTLLPEMDAKVRNAFVALARALVRGGAHAGHQRAAE